MKLAYVCMMNTKCTLLLILIQESCFLTTIFCFVEKLFSYPLGLID